jgi:glucose dehydrogenase
VDWSVPVGGAVTRGPVVGDGVVYVGATGGPFSSIDVEEQAVRWTVALGPGEVGTPTLGDGLVYVGRGLLAAEGPHDLVAIETDTGRIAWNTESPAGKQVHMGGLADGRVFAGSEDGNLYALDPASGAELWHEKLGHRLTTPVGIVDDTVYVSVEPHSVVAVDTPSGHVQWRMDVVGDGSVPAVINGRVFVGTDLGRVVAIGDGEAPSGTR